MDYVRADVDAPRPETPSQPPRPPMEDPPSGKEPVIDEPGREVPAVDPRVPGAPRKIREPKEEPEDHGPPGRDAPTSGTQP